MITWRDWFFLGANVVLLVLYRSSFLVLALWLWLAVQLGLWVWAFVRTRGHELRLSPMGFERIGAVYRIRVPWDDVYRIERAGGMGDKYWLVHHAEQPIEPVEGLDEVPAKVLARANKVGLEHQTALAMFTRDPLTGPFGDHLRRYSPDVVSQLARDKGRG